MAGQWTNISRRPRKMLPVAGIDVEAARQHVHSLRLSAGAPEQGGDAAGAWLQALLLAQVASDRLLLSVALTQRSRAFWGSVWAAGGARRVLLLLGQGPRALLRQAAAAVGATRAEPSAVDLLESKLLTLQALEESLMAALAAVHDAADGLWSGPKHASEVVALSKHGAAAWDFEVARDAAGACSRAVAQALAQLQASARASGESDTAARQGNQQDAVAHLKDALGVDGVPPPADPRDIAAALRWAHATAAALGPLVDIPPAARMPSHLQRHWIRYTAAGVASTALLVFLYRHSRLSGSDDLDNWAASAAATLRASWRVHVVEPLQAVGDELFATFRDRPSIVSPHEFETDKAALLRMIEEVAPSPPASSPAAPTPTADASVSPPPRSAAAVPGGASAASVDAAIAAGMGAVMAAYEGQLRSPLRNLLAGSLMQLLLIQVQRLKVDTEAAMLELDQILRANELSISLLAAVPSLLLAGAALRSVARLLTPRAPDAKREAVPCRMALVGLERALLVARQHPTPMEKGRAVVLLQRVYEEAWRVYRLRDRTSRYSEWPELHRQLLELARCPVMLGVGASAGGTEAAREAEMEAVRCRLETLQCVARSFALFQP